MGQNFNKLVVPYKCAVCGETFYITCRQEEWAYKIRCRDRHSPVKNHYAMYCTYKCWRVDYKPIEERLRRKRADILVKALMPKTRTRKGVTTNANKKNDP